MANISDKTAPLASFNHFLISSEKRRSGIASGIIITVLSSSFGGFATGALFLGIGTAMVYPTLLAAIGDVAHPSWRASSVGIYRLWRDSGYAIGAIISGITADLFGLNSAIWLVAFITFLSGFIVVIRMKETLNIRT